MVLKFENLADDSDEFCFPEYYEIMKLLEELNNEPYL